MIRNRNPKIFYGYIIAVVTFIILGVAGGGVNTFGVFFEPMLLEFGWARAVISGAFSLTLILGGFLSIVTGRLTDKFGSRFILTISGFLLGVGYILMSRTNAVWELYLFYGVIMGIGMSGVIIPLLTTLSRWFVKKRGMMNGLSIAGTGIGTIVMPILANRLISSYGWRISFIAFGVISFVIIILTGQFLRRDPQSKGQLPDGDTGIQRDKSQAKELGLSFGKAIRTRQLWLLAISFFCVGFSVFTIIVHIVIHATGLGFLATNAVSIVSIVGGANIVGRIVMGSAVDRIGSRSTLITSLIIMLVAVVWLQYAKELWMLHLFAAIFGVSYGASFVLVPLIVGDFFGLSSLGVIVGLINASLTTGGTVGPVLIGYIFDVTGSYQSGFLILAIVSVIGLVMALLLKANSTTNPP